MRNLRLVHSSPPLEYSSRAAKRADEPLTIAPLDAEVRAMLEHLRIIRPLPDSVRARVLARARAAITASACPAPAGGRRRRALTEIS